VEPDLFDLVMDALIVSFDVSPYTVHKCQLTTNSCIEVPGAMKNDRRLQTELITVDITINNPPELPERKQ
jgi:hypothetical protein